MVDRFDPPRDLDCKPLPMRPDIDGQYVRYSDLVAARAEIERLRTIIDNLHAVEEKHRETANAEFHRANRLQAESDQLREAIRQADDILEDRGFAIEIGARRVLRIALSSTGEKG